MKLGPNHKDGCDGAEWKYSGEGYNRVKLCACGAEDHSPDFTKHCVVCAREITHDYLRCTNSCCGECHLRFCTHGVEPWPGHRLDVAKAKAALRDGP